MKELTPEEVRELKRQADAIMKHIDVRITRAFSLPPHIGKESITGMNIVQGNRIGFTQRQAYLERLGYLYAEGYLTLEEYDSRVEWMNSSQTYEQAEFVFTDLRNVPLAAPKPLVPKQTVSSRTERAEKILFALTILAGCALTSIPHLLWFGVAVLVVAFSFGVYQACQESKRRRKSNTCSNGINRERAALHLASPGRKVTQTKGQAMNKIMKTAGIGVAGAALIGAGAAIGASAAHTTVTNTVTLTKNVPGPVTTKTVTVKVPVPGPTVYRIKYVPASQGPTGTVIATYSGQGNENTGSFTVPDSGDYVVKWSYSGNTDGYGATNFNISDVNTTGMMGDLPNDIAVSGNGSTEDTGMSGTQSFNVQATGNWNITVISAS